MCVNICMHDALYMYGNIFLLGKWVQKLTLLPCMNALALTLRKPLQYFAADYISMLKLVHTEDKAQEHHLCGLHSKPGDCDEPWTSTFITLSLCFMSMRVL